MKFRASLILLSALIFVSCTSKTFVIGDSSDASSQGATTTTEYKTHDDYIHAYVICKLDNYYAYPQVKSTNPDGNRFVMSGTPFSYTWFMEVTNYGTSVAELNVEWMAQDDSRMVIDQQSKVVVVQPEETLEVTGTQFLQLNTPLEFVEMGNNATVWCKVTRAKHTEDSQ